MGTDAVGYYHNSLRSICEDDWLAERSRDVLIFNVPIAEEALLELDFPSYRLGAENQLSCKLVRHGFSLANPCRALPIYHNHCSGVRNGNNFKRLDTGTDRCYAHTVKVVSTFEELYAMDVRDMRMPNSRAGPGG